MTDEVFMARLHGYAYATQARGYATGGVPESFQPIIPYFKNEDGTINRVSTLAGGSFIGIIGVEKVNLLKTT